MFCPQPTRYTFYCHRGGKKQENNHVKQAGSCVLICLLATRQHDGVLKYSSVCFVSLMVCLVSLTVDTMCLKWAPPKNKQAKLSKKWEDEPVTSHLSVCHLQAHLFSRSDENSMYIAVRSIRQYFLKINILKNLHLSPVCFLVNQNYKTCPRGLTNEGRIPFSCFCSRAPCWAYSA